MVCCYAVRVDGAVYLIDTGFIGGMGAIERALDQEGWRDLPVKGILVTHGHLDHTLNAVALASKYGAWVAAPLEDRSLLEGDFRGDGLGRLGGVMQQVGAAFLKYRKPDEINWFHKGSTEKFAESFKRVVLPGHTAGHSGFLFGRYLFCGDLIASHRRISHWPPSIFNKNTEQAKRSLKLVAEMDIDGIYPNHCDQTSPEVHLERLRKIANGLKA